MSELVQRSVSAEHEGVRLDQYLALAGVYASRSAATKAVEEGLVSVNDEVETSKKRILHADDDVAAEVKEHIDAPIVLEPQQIPLDIRYEDDDLIVLSKQRGLVCHPSQGHVDRTLANALLWHCGPEHLGTMQGTDRPGIVHRIDRDTSGLIIAAKNDFSHQKLAAQLQDHTLARVYRCIVVGNLKEDAGTVDAPIGRHPVDRKKMAVVANGRPAVTHWRVLDRFRGFTHVECRLETGRTHQIRVHMAYIGHPILGDTVYGSKKPVPGLQGQCLHAVGLRFLHPRTGEMVELHCGLPEEFRAQLCKLAAKR